jgi:protein translocase SecG subunit
VPVTDQTAAVSRRSGPLRFGREILTELRSAHFPSRRRAVLTTVLVVTVIAALAATVHSADLGLHVGTRWLLAHRVNAPAGEIRTGIHIIQALAALLAGTVLLRHPGPSTTSSLFGASASDLDTTPATEATRRLHRLTTVAVTVFAVSSLTLVLLP